MIVGIYTAIDGAFITGFAYFRPPADQLLQVRFLVDSGAAHSFLSLADVSRLPTVAKARLSMTPFGDIRGIGGTAPSVSTPASLAFRHEDGGATLVGLNLPLLLAPGSADLPSILGRDVLFHGQLRFDPIAKGVYFDAPAGSFIL